VSCNVCGVADSFECDAEVGSNEGRLGSGVAREVANACWRFDRGHVSSRGPLPRPSGAFVFCSFADAFRKGEAAGLVLLGRAGWGAVERAWSTCGATLSG